MIWPWLGKDLPYAMIWPWLGEDLLYVHCVHEGTSWLGVAMAVVTTSRPNVEGKWMYHMIFHVIMFTAQKVLEALQLFKTQQICPEKVLT